MTLLILSLLSLFPSFAAAGNLAERLGYGPSEKLLILNIDDIGSVASANEAAREAFAFGLAHSGSLMMPGPAAGNIAAYFAGSGADFGVHLTLNGDGRPGRPWHPLAAKVPSLQDADGNLWASPLRLMVSAKYEEVAREMEAQIRAALATGLPITHVDPHLGAAFFRPSWIDAYANLSRKYRLAPFFPRFGEGLRRLLGPAADVAGFGLKPLLAKVEAAGFLLLDDYYLLPFPRREITLAKRQSEYLKIFRRLRPGVTAIALHPALPSDEFRKEILPGSPGEIVRNHEAEILRDPAFRAALAAEGVRLIGWREVQRAYDWDTVRELKLFK